MDDFTFEFTTTDSLNGAVVYQQCSELPPDSIPDNIVLGYGIGQTSFLFFIFVVDYVYLYFDETNDAFKQAEWYRKIVLTFKMMYIQKKTLFVAITHIWDQASDLALIVMLGRLWFKYDTCITNTGYNIEFGYYFAASLVAFCGYRLLSSIAIYRLTRNPLSIVSQAFDLELFRTIGVNIKFNSEEPCDPARYISSLEACYESSPQCLIQLSLLIRGFEAGGMLVLISFIISWYQVISRISMDDKAIVVKDAKQMRSDGECHCKYFLRLIYRSLEISLRLVICVLLWLVGGGLVLCVYLAIEFILLSAMALRKKDFTVLYGILALPLDLWKMLPLYYYRWVMNAIVAIIVTLLSNVSSISANFVPSFEERKYPMSTMMGLSLFSFMWLATVTIPIYLYVILKKVEIIEIQWASSIDRSFFSLMESENYKSVLELEAFGCEFDLTAVDSHGRNILNVIVFHLRYASLKWELGLQLCNMIPTDIKTQLVNQKKNYIATPLMDAIQESIFPFINYIIDDTSIKVDWDVTYEKKGYIGWLNQRIAEDKYKQWNTKKGKAVKRKIRNAYTLSISDNV